MLLFYHPAVWWVSRRIRIEREVCCDNQALAACGEPVNYARALTLMEEWRAAPSMMMAANRGPLTERVLRLLGFRGTSARSRVVGVGVSITWCRRSTVRREYSCGRCPAGRGCPTPSIMSSLAAVPEIESPQPVVAPASEPTPAEPRSAACAKAAGTETSAASARGTRGTEQAR